MKKRNKKSISNKPNLEKIKVVRLNNTIAIKGGRCNNALCVTQP